MYSVWPWDSTRIVHSLLPAACRVATLAVEAWVAGLAAAAAAPPTPCAARASATSGNAVAPASTVRGHLRIMVCPFFGFGVGPRNEFARLSSAINARLGGRGCRRPSDDSFHCCQGSAETPRLPLPRYPAVSINRP